MAVGLSACTVAKFWAIDINQLLSVHVTVITYACMCVAVLFSGGAEVRDKFTSLRLNFCKYLSPLIQKAVEHSTPNPGVLSPTRRARHCCLERFFHNAHSGLGCESRPRRPRNTPYSSMHTVCSYNTSRIINTQVNNNALLGVCITLLLLY